MFGYFKRRRRERLRVGPFPPEWDTILRRLVPRYGRLGEAGRRELLGHVAVLLAEKHFEGCNGLVVTDEMKVTIAGHAGSLLLRRPIEPFRRLITILIYPTAYVGRDVEPLGDHFVLEGEEDRLGEAYGGDVVVLAWDEVRAIAKGRAESLNVVLHEFAHLLDMEDGLTDGAPALADREQAEEWARVLGAEYNRLRRGRGRTALDEYGGTDPAEFFAVATETFFERPARLQRLHPELYDQLKAYYRQDPAADAEPAAPG